MAKPFFTGCGVFGFAQIDSPGAVIDLVDIGDVVDNHRLVGDIDFYVIQPVGCTHGHNRRVHIDGICPVVEHGLSQTQGEVEDLTGLFFLPHIFGPVGCSDIERTLGQAGDASHGFGERLVGAHKRLEGGPHPRGALDGQAGSRWQGNGVGPSSRGVGGLLQTGGLVNSGGARSYRARVAVAIGSPQTQVGSRAKG